jgi:CSLREA domain-containing protein
MTGVRLGRTARLRMEQLEDRSVPSTFTVNTTQDDLTPANGKFSLREAITRTNTTAGDDVIVVPAGVFKLGQPGTDEDANLGGDLDITDAVTIQGAGAGLTIIDAQRLDRVIDVFGSAPSSIKVVLQGITVRRGNVSSHGGGIRVGNADLVVRDSAITANRAVNSGGGISNGSAQGTGNVRVIRTTIALNVGGQEGGGIGVLGDGSALTVNHCTIRRNIGGFGGGINATSGTVTNSTITGNTATLAGGGFDGSTVTMTGCTVSGNTGGSTGGGGIFVFTAILSKCTVSGNSTAGPSGGIGAGTATLSKCTVSGNSAGYNGGGIAATTATVTSCTIAGNSAGTNGGGVWAQEATLLNVTVAENSAHTGGGLFHNPGGAFSVKNTIVALNLVDATGTAPDLSGVFTDGGHNLIGIGSGSTGIFTGLNGNFVGTMANSIDPKLGPLQNNGGPTKTMALLSGSKAIDAGDNAGAPGVDQRGYPRVKDGNFDGSAIVDIGAFEK